MLRAPRRDGGTQTALGCCCELLAPPAEEFRFTITATPPARTTVRHAAGDDAAEAGGVGGGQSGLPFPTERAVEVDDASLADEVLVRKLAVALSLDAGQLRRCSLERLPFAVRGAEGAEVVEASHGSHAFEGAPKFRAPPGA